MDPKTAARNTAAHTAPHKVGTTARGGIAVGKGAGTEAGNAGGEQAGVIANVAERRLVEQAREAVGVTGFQEIGDLAVAHFREKYRGLVAEIDDPEGQEIVMRATAAAAKYSAMALADPANADRYKQNVEHAMNTLSNLRAELAAKLRTHVTNAVYETIAAVVKRVLPAVAGLA